MERTFGDSVLGVDANTESITPKDDLSTSSPQEYSSGKDMEASHFFPPSRHHYEKVDGIGIFMHHSTSL
jgi:hypothetical protein